MSVYDAVFHPEVQAKAKGNDEHSKRYTRAITALALDSIAEAHGVVLNARDFKLVKKKDNQHCIELGFSWETDGGAYYDKKEAQDKDSEKGVFGSSPLLSQLSDVSAGSKKQAAPAPSSLGGDTDGPTISLGTNVERPAGSKPLIQVVSETASAVVEPKYSLEHVLGEEGQRQSVLRVQLPGVSGVGEVELEVGSTEVSVSVEERFELILVLDHPIDEDEVKAAFDKANSELALTLTHL